MTMVLVAQMGKVASRTVTDSLQTGGFRRRNIKRSECRWLDAQPGQDVVIHSHDMRAIDNFMKRVRDAGLQERLVVVSLVRDVLSRNISAFFQNVTNVKSRHWYLGPQDVVASTSMRALREFFRERNLLHTAENVAIWPDKFTLATAIPILDRPFDTQRGASVYREADGVRCLILQVEKLSPNWPLVAETIGIPKLDMVMANTGDEKWYARLYHEFRKTYRPSRRELEACYDNSVMRHFYSEEDRVKFRARWEVSETAAEERLVAPLQSERDALRPAEG